MSLSLVCLVLGDHHHRTITIEIPKTKDVSILKDLIKEKKAPELNHLAASKLDLWQVSFPLDGLETKLKNLNLSDHPELSPAGTKVGTFFKDVMDDCLHIIAKVSGVQPVVSLDPAQLLSLNCLVLGDKKVFTVEIPKTKNASILKDLIKEKKAHLLKNVDASNLDLWKVSVPIDDNLATELGNFTFIDDEAISAVEELSNIFSTFPVKKHLHVFVKPPNVDKDILVPLLVARKMAKKDRGAPSTVGEPSEFDKTQEDSKTYLACCRPPTREPKLPLTLLDPVFAKFTDDCRTVKPTELAYDCAYTLRWKMNEFYPNEITRADSFRECLKTGGFHFICGPIGGTKYTTDGHILCNYNPMAISEVKNEIGSTGAEPCLQGLLYYEIFTNQYNLWTDVSSIHPCFIITLAGPKLTFAGSVLTDRCTLEIFSAVVLDFHSSNYEAYEVLSRHLTALRIALDTLSNRYSRQDSLRQDQQSPPDSAKVLRSGLRLPERKRQLYPSTDTVPYVSRVFPYPTTFTSLAPSVDGLLPFTYDAELEERSFFFTGQTRDCQSICIKFVRRYGKDVHIWCAEQGFAPKLIGFEKLSGGWFMVVMELLDESWITLDDLMDGRNGLKDKIHTSVVMLHQHGMVHGDLRSTNIMVRKSDGLEFMVIDFDWAGLVQQVNYPQFINTDPSIGRPEDVRYDVSILPQHDIAMVHNMLI